MEQFDLHGDLSSAWLPPYGQISDPTYLARVMLEPIIEETSDDDVETVASPELWSHYEQTWSSASDSGSVIRVDVNQADQDTISERDFACPAKRRRQEDAHRQEDIIHLRKPKPELEFKFRIDSIDPTDTFGKRYRLDEMNDPYSDSDNISFSSLSRSSSLIQFESLERQLQDGLSPFGGSTPSLHSMHQHFDLSESNKSEIAKQRYEHPDSKLTRNYYDVNKIDFTQNGFLNTQSNSRSPNSETSSSDNSIFSESRDSDPDVTILQIPSSQPTELRKQNSSLRCKNSTENLSEDSGYGEYVSFKIRSKSIPNFNQDNCIEEEEFEQQHKSVENVTYQKHVSIDFRRTTTRECEKYSTKIDATKRHSAPCTSHSLPDAKNTTANCKRMASQNISASLPNILDALNDDDRSTKRTQRNIRLQTNGTQCVIDSSVYGQDFSIVSSVPSDLNICSIENASDTDREWNCVIGTFVGSGGVAKQSRTSVASKNVDLFDLDSSFVRSESFRQQKVINASYNNLTVLDYSGGSSLGSSFRKMAENRKRNSGDFSKCNFLLDEISAHFDRELSILNDQRESYDPSVNLIENEKTTLVPPKPPPRKIHLQQKVYEEQNTPAAAAGAQLLTHSSPVTSSPKPKYTFDRDPTNLVTCYAESLEKCNFDLHASATSFGSNKHLDSCLMPVQKTKPVNRNLVVSTPNLNVYNIDEPSSDFMQVSSTHTSMNQLPQTEFSVDNDKKPGILSAGSKTSLGKGVSFCPIVSEISWKEQSSDEIVDDDDENADMSELKVADILDSCTEMHYNPQHKEMQQQQQHHEQQHQQQQQQKQLFHQAPNTQQNSNTSNDSRTGNVAAAVTRSLSDRDNQPSSTSSSSSHVNNNNNRSKVNINKTQPNLIGSSNAMIVNEDVPLTSTLRMVNDSDSGVVLSQSKKQQQFNRNEPSHPQMDNNNIRMDRAATPMIASTPDMSNNGAKSSIPLKPEKKHKGGFLSRFSGFRFSLRGKKKTKIFENNNATTVVVVSEPNSDHKVIVNKNNHRNDDARKSIENQRNSVNTNGDFIYIPLKDSQNGGRGDIRTGNNDNGPAAAIASTTHQLPTNSTTNATNSIDGNHMVVTTKPPLPRQPPRVVGVCAKPPSQPPAVPPTNGNKMGRQNGHAQRASSAPREIDDHRRLSLLDHEDIQYNQFCSDMMTSSGGAGGADQRPNGGGRTGGCGVVVTGGGGGGGNGGGSSSQIIGADGCEYKIGLIETNLDTHETIISGKTRSLMELGPQTVSQRSHHHHHHHPGSVPYRVAAAVEPRRPHKSMEFLLDKENQKNVMPPENELQKTHDNNVALSEHQLRVQASLQRLNIPEWYRQYSSTAQKQPGDTSGTYVPGSFTKKRNSDIGRWTGLNSKTTSLSSLGSHRSDRSPLLLSPSAHSHHGQTGFSRWSTSHLNSSQTSPSASARSSFSRGGVLNASILSGHSAATQNNIRNSFRQPYMGWRSQEKLAQPRTPAERLACSLLSRQPQKQQQEPQPEPVVTPEIQSSIKEVTSAIVHYVNDQTNRTSNSRSRSTSPTARKCWLESSFVGNRPLDSPQTPTIDNSFTPRSSSGNTAALVNRVNGVGESKRL